MFRGILGIVTSRPRWKDNWFSHDRWKMNWKNPTMSKNCISRAREKFSFVRNWKGRKPRIDPSDAKNHHRLYRNRKLIPPRLLESRLEEISLSEKNHFSRKGYSFFAECKQFESWIDRIIQGIIGGGIATEVKSIKDWVPLQLPGVRIIQVAPYLRIKILGTKYYASPIVRPFFARYQQYGPPFLVEATPNRARPDQSVPL